MLLGFNRQFEAHVLDGSKTHSIRALGGNQWRPGMRCDCFGDVRQSTMHLLGRWPCTRIEAISIQFLPGMGLAVQIESHDLRHDELTSFAWRDGFRPFGSTEQCPGESVEMMSRFWIEHNALKAGRLWVGVLIHWDFANPIVLPGDAERRMKWQRHLESAVASVPDGR